MSIIRHRTKNLILSALLGMFLSALILIGLWWFMETEIRSALMVKLQPQEAVTWVEVLVLKEGIMAGEVISKDNLSHVSIPQEARGQDLVVDMDLLIGETLIVDVGQGMPIARNLIHGQQVIEEGARIYELDFVHLPYLLDASQVVDVRISFPTGEDYVVLSKKKVLGVEKLQGSAHEGLLQLSLKEEEALRLSSALVDQLMLEGCQVYLSKYIDPMRQEGAPITYPVNGYVMAMAKQEELVNLLGADVARRRQLETHLGQLLEEELLQQEGYQATLEEESDLEGDLDLEEEGSSGTTEAQSPSNQGSGTSLQVTEKEQNEEALSTQEASGLESTTQTENQEQPSMGIGF